MKLEEFYSVSEVSKLLKISKNAVRTLFRNRRGVIRITNGPRSRMRIPVSVLREAMAEMGYKEVPDGDPGADAGRHRARA